MSTCEIDNLTTAGDMVILDGSAHAARLAVGTAGQVLTVVSGAPAWAAAGAGPTGPTGPTGPSGPTGPTGATGATPAFATNALVLGTAAAPGVATTTLRSDDTINAFDTTVPTTLTPGDAAATGSVAKAARRDHGHAGANALTTAGDTLYGGTSGVQTRLAIGSAGQAFSVPWSGTVPIWAWTQDLANHYLLANSAKFETVPRDLATTTVSLTSGTMMLSAIVLPIGLVISNILVRSVGAASVPTHYWFALYDNAAPANLLATTADQLTAAWAANTLKNLAIATIASGASTTFTTTYTGVHYIAIAEVATIANTLASAVAAAGNEAQANPGLCGTGDTGITAGPPAFPHTTTITVVAADRFRASVS